MSKMKKNGFIQKFRQDYKDSRHLVKKSIGVLIAYYLICYFVTVTVIYGICSMLWGLALETMPGNYISDSNIKEVIYHPLIFIMAIAIVFIFCIVCTWQNAGLLIILESLRQGKPVKLLKVLYKSLYQIRHVFEPKNWGMFLLVVIILPLTDAQMSSSALSEIIIPEYISDFIYARFYLAIPFIILLCVIAIYYFRYILVQQSFVLEQKSFKEAVKTSRAVGRKNRIYLGLAQTLVSLISTVFYIVLPIIAIGICEIIVNVIFKNYSYASQITEFVMLDVAIGLLILLGSGYVKMHVMSFSLISFHSICDDENEKISIKLVDGITKTSGKIIPLKLFIEAGDFIIYFLIVSFSIISILACEVNPELLSLFTKDTKIAAHKGYSSKAPENTMDAFELAYESGSVDMIELDVRESKDGVPVVIHNENLYEATGVNASVYDLDLADLQKLKACYSYTKEYPDAYIPTLEEVLDKYAGKIDFLIEIKYSDRTPDLPIKIADMMEKYNITDSSMIHSGSYEAISKVKQYNPDIQCGFIMAFCTGGYYNMDNADFFSVEHDFVTDTSLYNAHIRGKKMFAWTVNEAESMDAMSYVNVDMVITDYPDECNERILGTSNTIKEILSGLKYNMDFIQYVNPDSYLNDYEIDSQSY